MTNDIDYDSMEALEMANMEISELRERLEKAEAHVAELESALGNAKHEAYIQSERAEDAESILYSSKYWSNFKSEITKARNNAFEEAARVAQQWMIQLEFNESRGFNYSELMDNIRALKKGGLQVYSSKQPKCDIHSGGDHCPRCYPEDYQVPKKGDPK